MKTMLLFTTYMLLSVSLHAQKIDSTRSFQASKNEFGIIANPIGVVLLGAEPLGKRIGISYKRNYKNPDLYITSGAYYQGYSDYNDKNKEQTLELTGWLRKIQRNSESSHRGTLALGVEKRKVWNACPLIIAYYGIEAQFNYTMVDQNIGFQWYEADSTANIDNNFYQFRPISDFVQTRNVTKTIIGSGFQVNLGVQLHLNKRFYLFAQTAPSFLLSRTTRVDNDILNNRKDVSRISTFDFDMRAVIADIGIFLKL